MLTITSSHGMPLDEPLLLPVPDTAAWREVVAMGMDVVMLYESWKKTPVERVRDHARALDLMLSTRESFGKQYGEP